MISKGKIIIIEKLKRYRGHLFYIYYDLGTLGGGEINEALSLSFMVLYWKDSRVNAQLKLSQLLYVLCNIIMSEFAQSCPTLCDPVNCNQSDSSIYGILQTRILEWVAISFSRGSSWPRDWTWVSRLAGRCFNFWATRNIIIDSLENKCLGFWMIEI